MNALFKTIRGDFAGDGEQVVVENHDVVAVPSHATADVQQNLRHELQHAGNLVRDVFGRMIMAGIQREQLLSAEGVPQVKLMRADDKTFAADAEQLRLHRIQVQLRRNGFMKDRVERFGQACAGPDAIGGRVFHAVRNPHVRHARIAERLTHRRADFAAANAMFDPEFADTFVRVRQREAISGFRM